MYSFIRVFVYPFIHLFIYLFILAGAETDPHGTTSGSFERSTVLDSAKSRVLLPGAEEPWLHSACGGKQHICNRYSIISSTDSILFLTIDIDE